MTYFEGNTRVSAQNDNVYSFHNNIKVNRPCSSIDTTDFLTMDEITFTGFSVQVTKQ